MTCIAIYNSSLTFRPHGSPRSCDPGIVELNDYRGQSARHLHSDGGAGCGRRVHMGVPRTTGQHNKHCVACQSYS